MPFLPAAPLWTGHELTLFHGTTRTRALAILQEGVRLDFCRDATDFGRGLYTTTWQEQADEWARRKALAEGEVKGVLQIRVDRYALAALRVTAFVRGTLDATDFWNFVRHCRAGETHLPSSASYYDVVYGPVTGLPFRTEIRPDYDQVSFHTASALSLLRDDHFSEVVLL